MSSDSDDYKVRSSDAPIEIIRSPAAWRTGTILPKRTTAQIESDEIFLDRDLAACIPIPSGNDWSVHVSREDYGRITAIAARANISKREALHRLIEKMIEAGLI